MLQHEIMVHKPPAFDSEGRTLTRSFVVNCGDSRLKQELRIAAGHCQILAEKLCGNDLSPSRKAKMSTTLDRCSAPDGECCREQRLKLKAIVAENIKLRQVLKDVTEINKRWQKYNSQQQHYIQRLHATIEVLQNDSDVPINPALEIAHVPFRQEEERNKISLMDATKTLSSLKKSYEKAVKENCRLEKQVLELRKSLESKDREECLEERTQGTTKDSDLRDAQEQTEVLRVQARMHREDWEAEKAEKDEAKRRLARAEDDIRDLTSKCQTFESRLHRIQAATLATLEDSHKTEPWEETPGSPSCAPMDWHCKQSNTPTHSFHNSPQLQVLSRTSSKRNKEDFPKDSPVECDVELDFASPPRSPRDTNFTNSLPQRTSPTPEHLMYRVLSRQPSSFELVEDCAKDIVSCPSCQRQFPADQHLRFLDHFDECQFMQRKSKECSVNLN